MTEDKEKLQALYDDAVAKQEAANKKDEDDEKNKGVEIKAAAEAEKKATSKKGRDEVTSLQRIGGGGHLLRSAFDKRTARVLGMADMAGGRAPTKTPEQKMADGQSAMIAIMADSRVLLREIRDRISPDTTNTNGRVLDLREV